jgi:hypothetical protein
MNFRTPSPHWIPLSRPSDAWLELNRNTLGRSKAALVEAALEAANTLGLESASYSRYTRSELKLAQNWVRDGVTPEYLGGQIESIVRRVAPVNGKFQRRTDREEVYITAPDSTIIGIGHGILTQTAMGGPTQPLDARLSDWIESKIVGLTPRIGAAAAVGGSTTWIVQLNKRLVDALENRCHAVGLDWKTTLAMELGVGGLP